MVMSRNEGLMGLEANYSQNLMGDGQNC